MERAKGKDRFREQSEWLGEDVIKKKIHSKSSWRHILNTSALKILEHLWSQDIGRGHLCFESFADIVTKTCEIILEKWSARYKTLQ